MNKLRSLNCPVTILNAIHTGGTEAHKADSDVTKGLEPQLLLARGASVMLGLTYGLKLAWLIILWVVFVISFLKKIMTHLAFLLQS